MISEEWENKFVGAVQTALPILVSDHYPILLDGGDLRKGLTPFRFKNMWLKEKGFRYILQTGWQGLNFRGLASFVLVTKLKALKPLLKN